MPTCFQGFYEHNKLCVKKSSAGEGKQVIPNKN